MESNSGRLLQAFISFLFAGIASRVLLGAVTSFASRTPALFQAVLYLLLVFGGAALAAYLTFLLFRPRSPVPRWPSVRPIALTAIWFAPATLLAKLGPWWTVAGAAAAAVIATKFLRRFQPEDATDFLRSNRVLAAFFAALALQSAIVATSAGQMPLAVLLVVVGCLLIAWQPAWRYSEPSQPKLAAQILLVLALLFIGFILNHPGRGFGAPPVPLAKTPSAPNLLKGVILLTKPKQYVKPLPKSLSYSANPLRPAAKRPTSIPFSGEYWVFPSLFRMAGSSRVPVSQRPPIASLVKQGDPINSTFSSTVRWMPLVMKAHQSMDTPVDLSGFQHIDVAVTIPDYPSGLVSIELILLSSSAGHPRWNSLGQVPVAGQFGETKLRFTVPASLDTFEAIEVIFNLEALRDKSAKVAIDRFDLVPSGL